MENKNNSLDDIYSISDGLMEAVQKCLCKEDLASAKHLLSEYRLFMKGMKLIDIMF